MPALEPINLRNSLNLVFFYSTSAEVAPPAAAAALFYPYESFPFVLSMRELADEPWECLDQGLGRESSP